MNEQGEPEQGEQEITTIRAAFIDFYSDRATAHASFVVATIFGIYTVLFAQCNGMLPSNAFVAVYVALLILDLYSFLNFMYYATSAVIIREKLETRYNQLREKEENKYKKEMRNELKNKGFFVRNFRCFRSAVKKKLKFGILFILWFVAVLLPFIYIMFSSYNQEFLLLRITTLDLMTFFIITVFAMMATLAIYRTYQEKKRFEQDC